MDGVTPAALTPEQRHLVQVWLDTLGDAPDGSALGSARAVLAAHDALVAEHDGLVAKWCKDGETLSERLDRERADTQALMGLLATEKSKNERLRAENGTLKARLDVAAPHICHECGPHVRVDEEGCCAACGTDTYFALPAAPPAPKGQP